MFYDYSAGISVHLRSGSGNASLSLYVLSIQGLALQLNIAISYYERCEGNLSGLGAWAYLKT